MEVQRAWDGVTPVGPLNAPQIPDPPLRSPAGWYPAGWAWFGRVHWAEGERRPERLHFIRGAQAVPGWCLPRGRGWVHLGSRRARASAPLRYRAAFLAFAIDDPLASEIGRHTRSTESPSVTHGRGINPFLNSPISYFHPIH